MINESIRQAASAIKLLILDVDGVLTDGKISLDSHGGEIKNFHIHDGLGIKRIQKIGIIVAIISGRTSPIVTERFTDLGVHHIYQGQRDKTKALQALLTTLQLRPNDAAFVGDDLLDIPVMQQVGFSVAVPNAVAEVKKIAHWQTKKSGGEGAVREVCDLIFSMHHAEEKI